LPSHSRGNVFVAQLDRAPDYGSGGLGFESLREHLKMKRLRMRYVSDFFCPLKSKNGKHEIKLETESNIFNKLTHCMLSKYIFFYKVKQ